MTDYDHYTLGAGWTIDWNQPSFTEARRYWDEIGRSSLLYPTLADAYRAARKCVRGSDTYPARVFWVVRDQ